MARECITPLSIALTTVIVPLPPTCIITVVAAVVVRRLPVVSWTAAERPRIVVVSVAGSEVGLLPVIIAITILGGATVPAIGGVSVSLIVPGVVIAKVEIHIAAFR